MNRKKIKQRLLATVGECTEVPVSEIDETLKLNDDMGLDSLDKIDLWLRLESEFKIDIPEEKIRECETVGHLIDLIAFHLKKD